MIDFDSAISYCKEPISNIENYELAIADTEETWVCHHREELFEDGRIKHHTSNLKLMRMYYNQPADKLIFLRRGDHIRLHAKSGIYAKPWTEERKKTRNLAYKGKNTGESNPMYGKKPWNANTKGLHKLSDETKNKISSINKGKGNPMAKNKYAKEKFGLKWNELSSSQQQTYFQNKE